MTSCNSDTTCYISSDKGVIGVKKVDNGNEVTIKLIQDNKEYCIYSCYFLTHKQYNINDTIYLKNK